ncbi:DUF1499 domain-containing protein [Leptospira yasudae]|uniref:DUF1499 domain-containing protein n=1 Tax=Leptospira yasudae TaxID=2202201 RepID=A0A6N4QH79_9LEPT|nr:DUF1499 domain-containing protein [Leptospira yasudae]TGL83101.1 DUF1499 domain-containing protein [Leptospira yasudae]TGL85668.1 DUF1499 domain-containing protein [Leptospira yasudae]
MTKRASSDFPKIPSLPSGRQPNSCKSKIIRGNRFVKNGVHEHSSTVAQLSRFLSVVCILLFIQCTGTRPITLGIQNGKLGTCPETPNCVSSFAPASDQEHFIQPLTYSGNPTDAKAKLKNVILGTPRTNLIKEEDKYLYVEFTSLIWRFVDDVEFVFDANAPLIHVRSASRLGKSDLGVNRKRIETIRAQFSGPSN